MHERLSREICSIVKRELKKCGISYRELAALLDISEVSVKRLLNSVQPLSMQRLINISQVINLPVSKLFEEAETNLSAVPLFTQEQDAAFFACPALFTFWSEFSERRTVDEVAERHQLDEASIYLYLRKLEVAELIELRPNNDYRLLAPPHTGFEKGAKFPNASQLS